MVHLKYLGMCQQAPNPASIAYLHLAVYLRGQKESLIMNSVAEEAGSQRGVLKRKSRTLHNSSKTQSKEHFLVSVGMNGDRQRLEHSCKKSLGRDLPPLAPLFLISGWARNVFCPTSADHALNPPRKTMAAEDDRLAQGRFVAQRKNTSQ